MKTATFFPPWLLDLFSTLANECDPVMAVRWKAYQANRRQWSQLAQITLRFEPIEYLTPKLFIPVTSGFELLAMSRQRAPYGKLVSQAKAAGVEKTDLDLAALALALQTIRNLRQQLTRSIGPEAGRLYFSVNLNNEMLGSKALRVIVKKYFDADTGTLFELSERFPAGLAESVDAQEKLLLTNEAIRNLEYFQQYHKLQFILDDSDQLDAGVRAALQDFCIKTKIDARYTANVFNLSAARGTAAQAIIQELARFRLPGKPYVIEGIETQDQYRFLQEKWPDAFGDTFMQGWAIGISQPLRPFFKPMHKADFRQPRGYCLKTSIAHELEMAL